MAVRRKAKCERKDPENGYCIPLWGVIFTVVGVVLLWTSETAYINHTRSLREAMTYTEVIDSDELDGGRVPRLIASRGPLTSDQLVVDEAFGFGIRAVRLKRTTAIWKKCSSKKKVKYCWKENESFSFFGPSLTVGSDSFTNPSVRFGTAPEQYELSSELLIDQTSNSDFSLSPKWWTPLPCTEQLLQLIADSPHLAPELKSIRHRFRSFKPDGEVNHCEIWSNARNSTNGRQIGDQRFWWSFAIDLSLAPSAPPLIQTRTPLIPQYNIPPALTSTESNHLVSLIALQAANRSLVPYEASSGRGERLGLMYPASWTAEDIYRDRIWNSRLYAWIGRGVYSLLFVLAVLFNWVDYVNYTDVQLVGEAAASGNGVDTVHAKCFRRVNTYLKVIGYGGCALTLAWSYVWTLIAAVDLLDTYEIGWSGALMASCLAALPFVAHYTLRPSDYDGRPHKAEFKTN